MPTLLNVLGWAHWGGLALLLVGYALSVSPRVISPVMVWGARLQFLIGLALVGVTEMLGGTLNHMFVGIKLLLALAVVALCEIASSKARKGQNNPMLMHIAVVLVIVAGLYGVFGR